MNSPLEQRLLRLKDVQDIAKAAQENCLPETFTMTMKSRMGSVERLLWKTAEFCVVRAMQLRQRRQMSRAFQKPSATIAKRGALENRLGSLARVIHDGKRKYLVP